MNINKPKFWDLSKPNFLAYTLLPLTLFIKISNFFLGLKKIEKNKTKSICVGNIYIGGTGKTPTSIKIYKLLKKIGYKPAIGKKFYENQLDETTVIKNYTKVIVNKSRKNILNKAKQNKKNVIIFDDGLQDKNVSYNLQIVCFDSSSLIGNGLLIPAGPLREKLESLAKYDCVIFKGNNLNNKKFVNEIKRINNNIKIFSSFIKIKNINTINKSRKNLIFSGIGNPINFKKLLLKNKINISKEIIFADHHKYNENDIIKIKEFAKKKNLQIITTEKDFVKLSKKQRKNINVLKIEIELKKEKKFINFLKSKLNEKG